ncbi:MAG TPA: EamA family transporter [Ramlibacter sp.]|nr:EamA family transporter [Ramlibacter sp.]
MSLRLTLLTVFCVVLISVGQLLFKKAASGIQDASDVYQWLFNGWLIAALVLYGVTTLFWVWILRYGPLHLAYPFMGLAFLFVPLLGAAYLGEPLTWKTLVGGALILAGIAIASLPKGSA